MIRKLLRLKTTLVKSASSISHNWPSINTVQSEVKKSQPVKVKNEKKKIDTFYQKVPNAQFFTELKLIEQNELTHKKRKRFSYKDNYTAALALPYSKEELEEKQDDPCVLLEMSKKYVVEHANRRVDLFFYTLIAYYRKNVSPTIGYTNLQHGKGRTINSQINVTEACHSSFIPSLLDETIYQHNGGGGKIKSLISGTHFMDSLNSTVELPPFVNAFDTLLENRCRQKCLVILGDVTTGKINPIEGLNFFLKMMQDILQDLKQQAEQNKHSELLGHSIIKQPKINLKLIDLVLNGTLHTTFSNETQNVADDYIQSLLRMTLEEKEICKNNKMSKEKLYLEKIIEIQNEILQSKSGVVDQNVPCNT